MKGIRNLAGFKYDAEIRVLLVSSSPRPASNLSTLVERLVNQASTLYEQKDHVSHVIAALDLPVAELTDRYDHVPSHGFDFEVILRIFLYKEVGDFSDSELSQRLTTTAKGIRAEAHSRGLVLKELPSSTADEDSVNGDRNSTVEFTNEQVFRTTRLARDHCFPAFETGRASNAKYSDQLIHDFQAKMSIETKWGTPTRQCSDKDEE